MKATFTINKKPVHIDLSKPIDISIPVRSGEKNPLAWYIDPPKITPVVEGKWVAKVSEGAVVNFNNIYYNPHAHGTHTECVGHITEEFYSINDCLKTFFFKTEVITIAPTSKGEDYIITKNQVEKALNGKKPEAVVVRTLPNSREKAQRNWSHSNWPYLLEEATVFFRESGIKHLLIDLPSVDREDDEGVLASHNAFWNTAGEKRLDATITEMIFVPHTVKDGAYLLNLQIASFHNDASPSKPVLYAIE
ncbi:MAG TPA: cyclase family protein [Leeuwenhoekiella sp.]|nr:cyclase family protein [Leeuwenhoekiella sp.]